MPGRDPWKECSLQTFPTLPKARAALIRQLVREKQARAVEGAFVLEGPKPIRELLARDAQVLRAVVTTPSYLEKCDPSLPQALTRTRVPTYICRETVLNTLSDVAHPPGILAVVCQPAWDPATVFRRTHLLGLYGESFQDPTNLGAIIRTASAFGIDAMWLSTDSVDVFNPKVVRATTGAILELPILALPQTGGPGTSPTDVFKRHHCALFVADPSSRQSRDMREITQIPARTILAFGNEGRGCSESTLRQATLRFRVPMKRTAESLNVAASAAIALYHFSGLRRTP
ncbi:MAG: TrmH family RNA methyltransferase [Nitrospiraceae bacterium]